MAQSNKKAVVKEVRVLEAGLEMDLSDWQIAATNANGEIVLATMDLKMPEKDESSYEIRPGAWRIAPKRGTEKIEFQNSVYFETETSEKLQKIFSTFKQNLHVYDELGLAVKKRGVLLGSEPGVGKSSLINNFCKGLLSETNAAVLFIDSENVDYEIVQRMFRKAQVGVVDFIVLVIEDIGGSDLESRSHHVDGTLLNFLDGQEGIFKIPTLIVATTNYLDSLKKSVNSRPGRFDVVLEVTPPGREESILFVENFMKRKLTEKEIESFADKKLTPAYLRECVIRHKLNSISFEEAVKEIIAQRSTSEQGSHKAGRSSASRLGFGDIDDL